jgi:putative NADPH-quinone reductase
MDDANNPLEGLSGLDQLCRRQQGAMPMTETLLLLSHPEYAAPRANKKLAEAAASLPDVEVVHLDGLYADGEIDLDREVARLIAAQRIVLQFPVQWYSTPPLLKVWQDRLFTRMFYVNAETEGAQIAGRPLMVAATAGNKPSAYSASGVNLFPLQDLLHPLRATVHRCGLKWQEPFILYEGRSASDAALKQPAKGYAERVRELGALRG